MVNSFSLLTELEAFLQRRSVDVEHLTAGPMIRLMVDWFRLVPVAPGERASSADALVYRTGGWSEGCATGFKFSLLRRVIETGATGADTEWFAGITLMFEPSGPADLAPFKTVSSDWQSTDEFVQAIEHSPAFQALANAVPMGVLVESGGLR
jgi:hypothetical protein